MKERPIIFSGESVRAILEGQKTQTRRVIKPQPSQSYFQFLPVKQVWVFSYDYGIDLGEKLYLPCPYGNTGDYLWVRETFLPTLNPLNGERGFIYKADAVDISDWADEDDNAARWKSSMFMPRAASRLTLEITNVRVERLKEISSDDAEKEGAYYFPPYPFVGIRDGSAMRGAFARKWDSINGKRGFSWESNPFVWVIEFRK